MYPYVDSNGLHCGYDGSTNLSLTKVMAGMIPMYSIVCNNHKKQGNQVCGLNSLSTFVADYAKRENFSSEEVLHFINNVICKQLSSSNLQLTFNRETNQWNPISFN